MRIILLFILCYVANAVSCHESGCTYKYLNCHYDSNSWLLNCAGLGINGPLHITNIPSGVRHINLHSNQITEISVDMFNGLTALQFLDLQNNRLETLSNGVFNGCTVSDTLWLNNNQLRTLPAGVFNGLTISSLYLENNQLTTLPAGVFNGLTVSSLYLHDNQLTTLPAGVFNGLTLLNNLHLQNNQLRTVSAGVFDGLTAMKGLDLTNNPILLKNHLCIRGYYRTRDTVIITTVQQAIFSACDLCTISGETRAITCWDHLGQNNTASNHPPVVCPRGSYCNRTTLNEYLCPEGT